MRYFRELFLHNRFFILFGGIAVLFALSIMADWLFYACQGLLVCAVFLVLYELYTLFGRKKNIRVKRIIQQNLSLSDENPVKLVLNNPFDKTIEITVIDELPYQFQERKFSIDTSIEGNNDKTLYYTVRPLERGAYEFGDIHVYMKSRFGLLERRHTTSSTTVCKVYPSVIQMRKYSLKAMQQIASDYGIKKIRRIGHSYEFEQIKNYVPGDDYRSINWKSSGRQGVLMVNQYTDEKSQRIYTLIDKSRVMKTPFKGLSLLDYAINASLALANVSLEKQDFAGLITFSDKIDTFLKADRQSKQLHRIMEALYQESEHHLEADYEKLYQKIQRESEGRSLLVLFTNFESQYALHRVLPVLRKLNRNHLVLVVFFRNNELDDYAKQETHTLLDIYQQTMATKLNNEKELMVQELKNHGIQAILSKPEELTVNAINKYLELKQRGLI